MYGRRMMAERRAVDAQPLAALVDLIVVRWEVLLHRPPDRPEPAEAPPDAQPEVRHLAQGLQGLGRKRAGLAGLAALVALAALAALAARLALAALARQVEDEPRRARVPRSDGLLLG